MSNFLRKLFQIVLPVLLSAPAILRGESIKEDKKFRLIKNTFTCDGVSSILDKCVYVIKPYGEGALIGSKRATSKKGTLKYLTLIDKKGKISAAFHPNLDGAVTDLVVQD